MSLLLLIVLTAAPTSDPRGFSFQVPAGFDAFPGFTPNGNKLYAFGKNLGTPNAITLTIDAIDAPQAAGSPSVNCGKLMAIDRTVNSPHQEKWNGTELLGVRMVMEHMFGQVIVFCLDVPVGVTLMVSGKPENETALREAFTSTVSSISGAQEALPLPLLVAAPLSVLFLFFFVRRARAVSRRREAVPRRSA
jgi:hypothetical protein